MSQEDKTKKTENGMKVGGGSSEELRENIPESFVLPEAIFHNEDGSMVRFSDRSASRVEKEIENFIVQEKGKRAGELTDLEKYDLAIKFLKSQKDRVPTDLVKNFELMVEEDKRSKYDRKVRDAFKNILQEELEDFLKQDKKDIKKIPNHFLESFFNKALDDPEFSFFIQSIIKTLEKGDKISVSTREKIWQAFKAKYFSDLKQEIGRDYLKRKKRELSQKEFLAELKKQKQLRQNRMNREDFSGKTFEESGLKIEVSDFKIYPQPTIMASHKKANQELEAYFKERKKEGWASKIKNTEIDDGALLADFNEKYDWEAIYENPEKIGKKKFFKISGYIPGDEKSVRIDFVDKKGEFLGSHSYMTLTDFENLIAKVKIFLEKNDFEEIVNAIEDDFEHQSARIKEANTLTRSAKEGDPRYSFSEFSLNLARYNLKSLSPKETKETEVIISEKNKALLKIYNEKVAEIEKEKNEKITADFERVKTEIAEEKQAKIDLINKNFSEELKTLFLNYEDFVFLPENLEKVKAELAEVNQKIEKAFNKRKEEDENARESLEEEAFEPVKDLEFEEEINFEENLKIAREDFVKARAEAWQQLSLIERALGAPTMDIDSVDTVESARKKYEEALMELKDHEIEKIKTNRKELGDDGFKGKSEELIKYFDTLNKIELADALYVAKKSVKKGKFEEFFSQVSSQVIEKVRWYKKLPKKYQIALGVAMLGGGITLASTGSVALGAGAISLDVARRLLGSFSAGVGAHDLTKKGLEWREKRKFEENLKKDKEKIQEGIAEGKEYEVIDALIQNKIAATDKSLEKILKKEKIAKIAGFTVGALSVGMGVFKYLEKYGFTAGGPKVLDQESITRPKASAPAPEPVEHRAPAPEPVEHRAPASEPVEHRAPASEPVEHRAPASEPAKPLLEIEKGGNISSSLQSQGMDGKTAYRMILNYAKEQGINPKSLDTVYPGQKIILNPDGTKILRILESHDSHIMKSIKEISKGKVLGWGSVKGLQFEDIKKPAILKNLSKVMEKYHEILGDKANPQERETVQRWVARMAKLAMLKQK